MNKAFKIIAFIVTVILLCGVTVSCGKDDPDPTPVPETTDETIIMFFPYSGLESAIETNILDFKSAIVKRGGLKGKRIIVCQAWNSEFMNMYEIKYNGSNCYDSLIVNRDRISFNSYDQETAVSTLTNIFLKMKECAPSQGNKYSMIIGCHGSAWLPAGNELSSFNTEYSAKRKAFGSASSTKQINNTSLATALTNAGMHLDFMLFDACYMGNIETVYDFRSVTNYIIASPNEIISYGMPYAEMGDAILNHDYEKIVDTYYNFYSAYKYPLASISVIDCSELDNMANIIYQMNQIGLSKDANLSSVQTMDDMGNPMFYDLSDFCENFCTNATVLASFKVAMKALVPYARSTQYVFTSFNSTNRIYMNKYCGISTSQPTENVKASNLLTDTAWWKATH